MVSPGKVRSSGFSRLSDGVPYASGSKGTRIRMQTTNKYQQHGPDHGEEGEDPEDEQEQEEEHDPARRLRRIGSHVRQSLAPFQHTSNSNSNSSSPKAQQLRQQNLHANVPATATITTFLATIPTATSTAVVEVDGFRKCLFALGLPPNDTAFLIESLDKNHTGSIPLKLFTSTFLPPSALSPSSSTSSTTATGKSSSTTTTTTSTQAIELVHQKVIEKCQRQFPSVKDAFRQYDTNRVGVLTMSQFRLFMRELGFIGRDVEALARHLDRHNQQAISFHAFSQSPPNGQLRNDQNYSKTPSPKKKTLVQPLVKSPKKLENPDDPMAEIRAKLRHRVVGKSKSIREVFMQFDSDGNGFLDHDEFTKFMAAYHFTTDESTIAIEFLDHDFSGTIDYDEFAHGLLFYRAPGPTSQSQQQQGQVQTKKVRRDQEAKTRSDVVAVVRERLVAEMRSRQAGGGRAGGSTSLVATLRSAFARFDSNASGALDSKEFEKFLASMGIQLAPRDLEVLVGLVDCDGSKEIEFEEFAKVFQVNTFNHGGGEEEEGGEEDALAALFRQYDADQSGQLEATEFLALLRDQGVSQAETRHAIKQIYHSGSMAHDGEGVRLDLATFQDVVAANGWKLDTGPSVQKQHNQKKSSKTSFSSSSSSGGGAAATEAKLVTRILRDHQSLENAFRQYDLDASGQLEHDEFRQFMKHYGVHSDHEIDRLIDLLDDDSSGTVSLDEFLAHLQQFQPMDSYKQPAAKGTTVTKQDAKQQEALKELKTVWVEDLLARYATLEEAFRDHTASTDSNELDYEQFRDLLVQFGVSQDRNIRLLLNQLDTDHSGSISLQEFVAAFQPLVPKPKKPKPKQKPKKQTGKTNPKATAGALSSSSSTGGFAAQQAKANAVRLQYLVDQWAKRALATHGSIVDAFRSFDTDDSGVLDHREFTNLMETFGITRQDDISLMIQRLDLDGSGSIDYDEFATIFDTYQPLESKSSASISSKGSSSSKASSAVATTAAAARLRDAEIKWIKRALRCHATIEAAFAEYDHDGNGNLDHMEFTHLMKRYGIVDDGEIARLIRRLDLDHSGTIDVNEFTTVFNASRCADTGSMRKRLGAELGDALENDDDDALDGEALASVLEIERALADRILTNNTRDLRLAFRTFDQNGNGKLEYKEFRKVLKNYKFAEPEIKKVIRHLDKDVSGFIDYKEFMGTFGSIGSSSSGGGSSTTAGGGSTTASGSRRKSQAATTKKKNEANKKTPLPAKSRPIQQQQQLSSTTIASLKNQLLEKILQLHGTVQSTFRKYDKARNGALEPHQFEQMVLNLGFQSDEAEVLLELFDKDQSGSIEYEEFLSELISEGSHR